MGTIPAAIPNRIYAQASPRSLGGVSLFDNHQWISAATVANFLSAPHVVTRAVHRLQESGFEVLQIRPTTINIAGTPETYQRAFRTRLFTAELPVIKEGELEATATFLDSPDTPLLGLISTTGTIFEDVLEGVAIEEPRYFTGLPMFAPPRADRHLRVPEDVSLAPNADLAHRRGVTGVGVKVAMVDSGRFKHPAFSGRGYRSAPVVLGPGATHELHAESSYGTGEATNIFMIAPEVVLLPVKMSFVNTIGAFNAAVALRPDIITCSWGNNKPFGPRSAADQVLAASIAAAVASGITVIFSAGIGHEDFPAQHTDVISAAGVDIGPDRTLAASDYTSGVMSNIHPNRSVPDVSEIVGMMPGAIYIMLPVESGGQTDSSPWNALVPPGGLQRVRPPVGDDLSKDDGWTAFSGTLAAALQLAGAAALLKQVYPALSPVDIKSILMTTARNVRKCIRHPIAGPDVTAIGADTVSYGLVDVHRAALVAVYWRGTADYITMLSNGTAAVYASSRVLAAYYQGMTGYVAALSGCAIRGYGLAALAAYY